jgi:hypothetical protein
MIRRRRIEVHIERHELSIYSDNAAHPGPQSPFPASTAPSPPTEPSTEFSAWTTPFRTGSTAEERVLPADAAAPISRNLSSSRAKQLYCPICGADEMLPLAQAIAIARLTATALKEGLETGRYHLHCSLTGDWLICIRSMQQDMQQE